MIALLEHLSAIFELLLYHTICLLFRVATSGFFREVLKRGSHQIPATGPVIFVAAPHANQFVDPLVIMHTCPRPVRFLMAASSMRKGIPGFFGRLLRCIPVERPADLSKKGVGTVNIDSDDARKIIGTNTKFTEQFRPGSTALSVNRPPEAYTLAIGSVESDTVMYLKKPLDVAAIETIFTDNTTQYSVIPVIDQSEVYSAVFEVLERGECLGIFPEGGSHDRAEMLPLKAGVAIMALGAMARKPGLSVSIVPCGLNYFNPHKFRSRAMVEYGEPVEIDEKLVELFKIGGESRREACGRLLDQIYYSLCTVTINVPDYETLQVMQATRRLYQPTSRKLNTFELLEITRRFIKGYLAFKDEPKICRIRDQILEYNKLLNHFRLYDHQVRTIEIGKVRAMVLLLSQIMLLVIYGIVLMPGILLNLPAVLIIDYVSKRKAALAVASSSVKLAGRDVLATWKLIVGFVLLPSLYALYTVPFAYEMYTHGVTLVRTISTVSLLSLLVLPWLSYITIRVAERGYDTYASIRPLWYSVTRPHYGEVLRNLRHKLRREIIKTVNEYGPKLFGDFESHRIVPSRRVSLIDEGSLSSSFVDTPHVQSPAPNPTRNHGQEIDELVEEAKNISRTSSPLLSIGDGMDSVISGFEYMRSGVHSVFVGSSENVLTPAAADWSYVDPVEIDDIFFTQATPRKSKKDQ
jgi:glycerol-3-phosphate O-acyltransferase/dihydroxyacetone phosphate acyltransferase